MNSAARLPFRLLRHARYATTEAAAVRRKERESPVQAAVKVDPLKFAHLHRAKDKSGSFLRQEMRVQARRGIFVDCFALCNELRRAKIPLNANDFHCLLESLARKGLFADCRDVLDRMEAYGLEPGLKALNWILLAAVLDGRPTTPILALMKQANMEPDGATWDHLVFDSIRQYDLENSIFLYGKAKQANLRLSDDTLFAIALLACASAEPRIAYDVLSSVTEDQFFYASEPKRIECFLALAEASALAHFIPGLQWALDNLEKLESVRLPEGLLLSALEAFGREASPDGCLYCLKLLRESETPLSELHVAPLIEAFSRKGQIAEALAVINSLHETGHQPSIHAGDPIIEALSLGYDSSRARDRGEVLASLASGYDALVELAKEQKIESATYNVIIGAHIASRHVKRALLIHRDFPARCKFGRPALDVHTFNILLQGAIILGSPKLADQLLDELQALNITPTQRTYELIIEVFLIGAEDEPGLLEEAYAYIEELKRQKALPSDRTYGLLLKSLQKRKDPRANVLLAEIEHFYGSAVANKASRKRPGVAKEAPTQSSRPETELQESHPAESLSNIT